MAITDAQWLALCCSTESNRPHEWPGVAWVVRNRVEANRVMFGGDTYQGVILKRKQFSAFNGYAGTPEEVYEQVAAVQNAARLNLAWHLASYVLGTPREGAPFGPLVFYYWSPVSMIPAGKLPAWDWTRLRKFALPGGDPWRFIFAEEIR